MDTIDIAPRPPQADHCATMSVPIAGLPPLTHTDLNKADLCQECALDNPRFMKHLKFLTIIQRTIIAHKIEIPSEDKEHLYLGPLHMLYLASRKERRKCRSPRQDEWIEVERKIVALEKYLTPSLLSYVEINHLSGKILEKLAFWFLGISFSALIAAQLLARGNPLLFPCFTFWSAAAGALGSTAFLYVNALSIQVDPNVDLTSRTLVMMRLILGALFAVMLTVPFGYDSFYKFGHNFSTSDEEMKVIDRVLLLLPFTLGFSTPLALSILGRMIQSVRTFFGLGEQHDGSANPSKPRKPAEFPEKRGADDPVGGAAHQT